MGFFAKILSWFSSKEDENQDIKTFYSFPHPLEIDSESLVSTGNADGKMGRKVSEDALPHVINEETNKLTTYHQNQYKQAQEWFSDLQNTAGIAISETNVEKLALEIKGKSITSEFATRTLHASENTIKGLHESFLSAKKNYHQFKNEHNRSLLPQNSDPREIKTQYRIFFGLVILELIINIFVLYAGEAVSLSSAIGISVTQVTVNIGSCFLAGMYLFGRVKFAKGLSRIILGSIALLHGYLILVLNANMGLTRDIIQKQAGLEGILNPEKIAAAWQINPWPSLGGLEVQSVFVIGLGILFAVIAYIDGTKSDDLYPNYGAVYRKPLALKRLVDEKIANLLNAWAEIQANLNKEIKNKGNKANKSIRDWSKACNSIEQVWDDYEEVLKTIEKRNIKIHKFYLHEYNRSNVGENIDIKAGDILTEKDKNLKELFSDVSDYKFTDDVRERKEKEKATIFAREYAALQKEIDIESKSLTTRIKEIAKLFPCTMEK